MGMNDIIADLKDSAEIKNGAISDDAARVIMRAEEHFNRHIDQLKFLSECDQPIKFSTDGSEIHPGTDVYIGFQMGVKVALQVIGDRFPVKLSDDD